MKINVTGGTLPQQEIDYYTEAALKKYPNRNITAIDFDVDGEYVNATYHFNDLRSYAGLAAKPPRHARGWDVRRKSHFRDFSTV